MTFVAFIVSCICLLLYEWDHALAVGVGVGYAIGTAQSFIFDLMEDRAERLSKSFIESLQQKDSMKYLCDKCRDITEVEEYTIVARPGECDLCGEKVIVQPVPDRSVKIVREARQAKCKHENFIADVAVNRLTESDESTDVTSFACEVKVHCADCSLPFRFICPDVGIMNDRPCIDPKGQELRVYVEPSDGSLQGSARPPSWRMQAIAPPPRENFN